MMIRNILMWGRLAARPSRTAGVLLLALTISSCRDNGTEPSPEPELVSISIAPTSLSLTAPSPRLDIDIAARSNTSDIDVVRFHLRKRGDASYDQFFGGGLNLKSGTRRDGVWGFSVTGPSGFHATFRTPGTYYVTDLELRDVDGRARTWTEAELIAAGHRTEISIVQ